MARKKQEIALQKEINSQEEWDETMAKEGLFIIDIYQEWCGPCKSIVSLFRRLKNESGEDLLQFAVAKADSIDYLARYRGTCKPCFLFYGSGTLVEVIRGVNPPELEKQIKRHLATELQVLKGEPGVERVEIKDPAFKEIDEAERLAKEKGDDEDEEEEIEREVTVVLIKPDAMDKVDEIKQKLEERGIEILEQQERKLTEEEARDFYRHLDGQDWFEQMIAYMTSDTSTVLVIAKDNVGIISEFREILGPAIVEEAKEKEPESLRALFGSESFKNAIHAADSGEKAQKELQFFFPEFKIPTYKVHKPKKQKKAQMEKTVALVRPDAFAEFRDEILAKIKEAGFAIALKKEIQLTREQAEEFYSNKKDSPYFDELITRMTNGPVLALALAKEDAIKEWRNSLGEKNPKEAKTSNPQSFRAIYSKEDIEINLLHGSDSPESARKELEFFFPTEQTVVIIKPDAYENRDEILQRLVEADFTIALRRELTLTDEMARELYKKHAEKEHFEELIAHMVSGKCVILVVSRPDAVVTFRALMGDPDPAKATDASDADGHTIRADYGKDLVHNAVHGSSDLEHAKATIGLVFGDVEFDDEGKYKPGTGDVKEEDLEPATKDDGEFHSSNGEIVKTDAEEAEPQKDEAERPEGEFETEGEEGEQPAAEGEHSAEEGEQPAAEGEKAAAESDEPAAEGEQPAAEGQRPAAEGEQPAAEGEQPAAEGEQPATEGEQPATEGEQPAAEGEQPATEGEQPAAEGEQPAAEGERPAAEGEQPAGEKSSDDEQAAAAEGGEAKVKGQDEAGGSDDKDKDKDEDKDKDKDKDEDKDKGKDKDEDKDKGKDKDEDKDKDKGKDEDKDKDKDKDEDKDKGKDKDEDKDKGKDKDEDKDKDNDKDKEKDKDEEKDKDKDKDKDQQGAESKAEGKEDEAAAS